MVLKKILVTGLIGLGFASLQAQIKLSADFTNERYKGEALHSIWSVGNRISPTAGSNLRSDLKINLVRMIGGIKYNNDGKPVKNLDYDPCLYDSINNTYVYRWEPFIARLNKIVNSQSEILQIVLDQPPWAFQHGYTFIPKGECDSIHFRENERISIYGNSLPPADKEAYHEFIKALMRKLVETYGEEKVLSWRFRVGSEIETPDHWFGTKEDFIAHYANTERAVRAILPNAKVGVHTRFSDFLYKKGGPKNYKGQPFASFSNDLIAFCHDNDVRYDFWGMSDYVIISNKGHRQMDHKFNECFGSLVNHPKWNKNASLDLMEYATITSMGALGNSFVNCVSSHKEIVELAFSNQFYKHKNQGAAYIYRWGNRRGSADPVGIKVLNTMLGMHHYEHQTTGDVSISGNSIDAIFAADETSKDYDVLVYNFNAKSLDYAASEKVEISLSVDVPAGTKMYLRSLHYGKEQNTFQNFLKDEPKSGWIKKGFDRKGAPSSVLNKAGLKAYKNYENPNPYQYGAWEEVYTKASTNGESGSVIQITTSLPSFAFTKFEFKQNAL
ncbi:GH39 family glycosyl hydrolase [Saccharicrinis aurantiacus]|uniref:GH39 family glycosyl hydrolase n=1 Tax=Saccharicrinis aurantiacus TaxID=1849719 RepID=UPI002492A1A5|nr:hypothetical protein [Saccharicrinis aurantiacus]